jgi:hypothetical protein
MEYLSQLNKHPRDEYIQFDEPTHVYTIKGNSNYKSVTTIVHEQFEPFDSEKIVNNIIKKPEYKNDPYYKYYRKTREDILDMWSENGKTQSGLGTQLHLDIEYFNNQSLEDEDGNPLPNTYYLLYQVYQEECNEGKKHPNQAIEWNYFINYVRDHPTFQPYRTEWTVYDEELKIAGSIDMVYINPDGTLTIYDWKRAKSIEVENRYNPNAMSINDCISTIPDTNYWHYSLQLNIYKAILEKNYGKQVTQLMLVILHPNNKNYQLFECEDLQEEVARLFEYRKEQLSKQSSSSSSHHVKKPRKRELMVIL